MSVDYGSVRTGLQTALATLSGLNAYDTWPDQIICPAALVKPVLGEHHVALGRGTAPMKLTFEIILLAAPTENGLVLAQQALDPYLGTGTGSIQNALEADQSLGNAATSVVCKQWHSYGAVAVDTIEYAGVTFDVEVTAS